REGPESAHRRQRRLQVIRSLSRAECMSGGVVDNDASRQLDLEAFERAIGPRTKLIAITDVPTQGGFVNPAAENGRGGRTGLDDRVRLTGGGRRRAEIEEAGGAQLVDTRQLGQVVQSKMREESWGRRPEERAAGAGAPPFGADP